MHIDHQLTKMLARAAVIACCFLLWQAADAREFAGAARTLLVSTPPPSDHTLNQAGPICIENFFNITKEHYGDDSNCSTMIQQAFAAVTKDMCPEGGTAAGSPVQKCLSKTTDAANAWAQLIKDCQVLNVKERTPGVVEEPAKFSCFDKFATADDFAKYVGANGSGGPDMAPAEPGKTNAANIVTGGHQLAVTAVVGALVLLSAL